MLGSLTGAQVSLSGLSDSQAAAAGYFGGGGPVKQLAADYDFPGVSENGYTYVNDAGNSGLITITVPSGLPVGTIIRIVHTNTNAVENNVGLAFSGSDAVFFSTGSGTTIATGNVGGTCTVMKLNSIYWFVIASAGNVGAPV